MLGAARNVAIAEGGWTIALHVNTYLIGRTWTPPYPDGQIGHWTTRLLYGGSWSLMLGIESMVAVLANGGSLDWIAEASYRSDWVTLVDLPTCPATGAFGGCGMGVGGFSWFQVRPVRWPFFVEAGGGWIQQRVATDADRTMTESTWVLSPLTVLYEMKTDQEAPVALRALVGPGVFFGMHNAHIHPTESGQARYDPPWHQMYPLDAGAGPGGRAEIRVTLFRRVSVTGEIVVAPFVVGGPTSRASSDVAPLDFEREGVSTWRKANVGLGYYDRSMPFVTTLSFFSAELSERPVERLGYRGMMLRLDVPLRVP
jgi:hypothetical protein